MHASQNGREWDKDSLQDAAELLRAAAHPIRLRLIQMILRQACTVGELAGACGLKSTLFPATYA